jgi:hypothetical protein
LKRLANFSMLPLASSEGVVDATDDVAEAAGTGADPARLALAPAEVERKDVDRGGDGDEAQADLEGPSGAPVGTATGELDDVEEMEVDELAVRVDVDMSGGGGGGGSAVVEFVVGRGAAFVSNIQEPKNWPSSNDAKCLRTANGRSAGELWLRRNAKDALEEARRQVDHAKAGPKGASGQQSTAGDRGAVSTYW